MFDNENSVIKLEKISKRVKESKHSIILERINNLAKIDYEVYGHQCCHFKAREPIFTILLTLHDANLQYIIQSIKSIQKQTYTNTELIIIDNGSTGAISKYVSDIFLTDHQIKLLRTSINQYDPHAGDRNPLVDLWNAGLFSSVGDYVFFQSYDDLLSPNYVDSMVKLFSKNPKCVSASPLVSSINANGEINIEFTQALEASNSRSRYETGIHLGQNKMRNIHLINSPGGLLVQKSENVINYGGFDSMNDLTQIFRFAIHGDVGFDPQAMLFWRHHELQTNKDQTRMGISYYKEFLDMPIRYDLFKVHREIVGTEFAEEFKLYLNREASKMAIENIRSTLHRYGHKSGNKALFLLMKEARMEIILKGIYAWSVVSVHILLRRNPLVRRIVLGMRAPRN